MALERFELSSLATIDSGRVRAAFDFALERCIADLKDRPNVRAARILTIAVAMAPVSDEEGNLVSGDVKFTIRDNVPKRQSKTYNMTVGRSRLSFNELSPDDARQRTLDELRSPRSTEPREDAEKDQVTHAS